MRIRRLGWAGLEIEQDGETLLIDYVQNTSELPLRDDRQPFPATSRPGRTVAALLTHLHADHADPSALATALRPGAVVFRPRAETGLVSDTALTAHAEESFRRSELAIRMVDEWTSYTVGPFTMHAVPAVDGFGDVQVSWVVEADGSRIIHAGDTLFHGYWWRIADRFGPFDRAFLPINGAVVDFPFLQPTRGQAAVMTPEEAVRAACMLRARTVTPIHFEALHRPPDYVEVDDPLGRLATAAHRHDIRIDPIEPGGWIEQV